MHTIIGLVFISYTFGFWAMYFYITAGTRPSRRYRSYGERSVPVWLAMFWPLLLIYLAGNWLIGRLRHED